MPLTDKRKIMKTKQGTFRINPPKAWGDFFKLTGEEKLETISDAPFIAFPPQVKTTKEKIEALMKIVRLLEIEPEIIYPEASRAYRKKE